MCGIAGFWGSGLGQGDVAEITRRMTETLSHRGPDDMGIWTDQLSGLGLGHRRLSIIDLSVAGRQPMISTCGRYVMVFNGEIYNHQELRAELEELGFISTWRGHSDTETMLAVLAYWGVDAGMSRLNGMFAFALWDRQRRRIVLGRDRMGEKPLYYGRIGEAIVFGSELKALSAHPCWVGDIDRDVLALYLRNSYVPAPWTIYKDVKKLLPGHYVEINDDKVNPEQHCYWNLRGVACDASSNQLADSGPELVDYLDQQLRRSIGSRMEADVPLGAFLSGGVDSSTVVALMQAQSVKPVKTFSIGFDDASFNEAVHARAVARHLGTEHTEHYFTGQDALDVIPSLPEIWDEPFADASQLPTYLVSRLAREHVSVILSGDGGDELFGGYNRYVMGSKIWNSVRPLPPGLRRLSAKLLRSRVFARLMTGAQILPAKYRPMNLADRLPKIAEVIDVDSREGMYQRLVSRCKDPASIVLGAVEPLTVTSNEKCWPELEDFTEQMMWLDQVSYLPDDILAKVDRASMAVSLEARVPFLDHEIVELAWRIPLSEKIQGGKGKCILRKVLYNYVPSGLIERPKHGFGVPVGDWLRGPLREWGEGLLSSDRLIKDGFFDTGRVRRMWSEHLNGKGHWHHQLWSIVMFQAWHDTWRISTRQS